MLLSMEMSSGENLASQSVKIKNKIRSDFSESVFGEGKLLTELTIPKDGGEAMGDTEDPNIKGLLHKDLMNKNSDKLSVCDFCNKSFKCGKALGGHMRIHSQKGNKKNVIFKNKLKARQSVKFKKQNPHGEEDDRMIVTAKKKECDKNKSPSANNCAGSGDIEERPSCPVCGISFPSLKSVFGHMRKHSDRNWRGSRPPSIEKPSSESCLSYDENPKNGDQIELLADGEKNGEVDLTESLRGWNSTARRGRKRLSLEMDDFRLKELEAATGLMTLAGTDLLEGALVHRQKGDADLGEPFIKRRDQLEEKGYDVGFIDGIKNLGLKMLIKNKKRRKKVKLSDLEQPHNKKPVAIPFRCSTCEKSFKTRQAFGGHLSRHNKFTVVIKNVILESEKPLNPTTQVEETEENGTNLVEGTHHQSMVCNKSRSSHEIDLNKLPAPECEAEAGLLPGLCSC